MGTQVCVGAVEAEAIRAADGVRLRAHIELGQEPHVGRGRARLLPVRHAQSQGQTLARHHLPQRLCLVSDKEGKGGGEGGLIMSAALVFSRWGQHPYHVGMERYTMPGVRDVGNHFWLLFLAVRPVDYASSGVGGGGDQNYNFIWLDLGEWGVSIMLLGRLPKTTWCR